MFTPASHFVRNVKFGGRRACHDQPQEGQARLPEEVRQVVSETIRVFGRLHYAFNNAAISGPNRPLEEQSEATFDEVFQINVKSLFIIMQQEIHQMLHQGWGGSIVNMASVSSTLATPAITGSRLWRNSTNSTPYGGAKRSELRQFSTSSD